MNSIYKTTIALLIVFLYVLLLSYFWNSLKLPFSNENSVIGYLTLKKINPLNDTYKYILFILPPLIFILFYISRNFKNKIENFKNFLNYQNNKKINFNFQDISPIFILLIIYILVEFLSLDLFKLIHFDTLHDGDYLTPLTNYIYNKGFWSSSFVIHGGRDFIIPILSYNLFNTPNIAPIKYISLILILMIKFLSIILAFQLSRITTLNKNYKILIFTILSFFILSISDYYQHAYFDTRDIFVLVFFIFFIPALQKNNNKIINYCLTAITVLSLLFHYDTGVYLNLTFCIFLIYLFLCNKNKDILWIIVFLIFNWLIIYLYLGTIEINSFFYQFSHIINNLDKIHGLEYPQPFFSIGLSDDGARATKLLILILTTGVITSFLVLLKNNYLNIKEKILILFIYFYILISFKNALGRSDGPHIMVSSDWVTILFFLYVLYSFIHIIKNKFKLLINTNKLKVILSIFISLIILIPIKTTKIINYSSELKNFISTNNKNFLTEDKKTIIKKLSSLTKNERCIQNFTADLSLPYLLEKPNCTIFFSSWIASGAKSETDYINAIKKNNIKYIIYESPSFHVDQIQTKDRLLKVNSFIKKNYKEIFSYKEYTVVEKSNTDL